MAEERRLDRKKGAALMMALDACNRRFGRGTVVPGNTGFAPRRTWSTKFEMRSPRYTTRLAELPIISQISATAARGSLADLKRCDR